MTSSGVAAVSASPVEAVRLFGVRVHNLKGFDVAIPLHQLVAITGVSGSGKSTLAFDTLYAEGQRRYIESFPAHARQFLPKLDRPAVDRVENIPPAVAIGQFETAGAGSTLVAAAAGVLDRLRMLFAHVAIPQCPHCSLLIRRADPETVAAEFTANHAGKQIIVAFRLDEKDAAGDWPAALKSQGFLRGEVDGRVFRLGEEEIPAFPAAPVLIYVDRLSLKDSSEPPPARLIEALELAFRRGEGAADVKLDADWRRFTDRLACAGCGFELPPPTPALFHWSNQESACPACEGRGTESRLDPQRVFSNPQSTLREKGVAPLAGADQADELAQFLRQAKTVGLPIDAPLAEFTTEQRDVLWKGDASGRFTGVLGFFAAQETKRGGGRSLVQRYRRDFPCPVCHGKRFRPEVLAYRLDGLDFADVLRLSIDAAVEFFQSIPQNAVSMKSGLPAIRLRLDYLHRVGLGYLGLDRPIRTLSTGESRRIALGAAFGSGLSETLFVLDEPTAGLHPADGALLLDAMRQLQSQGNSLVVVEHDLDVIAAADHVIELGPGAGVEGGELVFQGSPAELVDCEDSSTAEYLASPAVSLRSVPYRKPAGWLQLRGARTHNLRIVEVGFPLGVMTVVAGVSGAGKSSLVFETLLPALGRALGDRELPNPECEPLEEFRSIEEVISVTAAAIGRSTSSNCATYLKFFDEVRKLFADSLEAKTTGLTAGAFSFNTAGGRCENCQGAGVLSIDMQFLPPVYVTCPECKGTRYQRRVLNVKYRGRNIAEVLDLTVRDAFGFFRNEVRIQERIKALLDVGLGYIRLGQPTSAYSGGEAQRLKLASCMGQRANRRSIFLFEEPTAGLHPADVETLLECLRALTAVGHTVIVVEHNPLLIAAADHVIELGPTGGAGGGLVVAEGTPATIAEAETPTGRVLRRYFSQRVEE